MYASSASSTTMTSSRSTTTVQTATTTGASTRGGGSAARTPSPAFLTSLEVFRRFIRPAVDGSEQNGEKVLLDASGIISKECYELWLSSRGPTSGKDDPPKAFRRALVAHATGTDGRTPFTQLEEEAVFRVLRKKAPWPCFTNPDGTNLYKQTGFRSKGFHERRLAGEHPESASRKRAKRLPETDLSTMSTKRDGSSSGSSGGSSMMNTRRSQLQQRKRNGGGGGGGGGDLGDEDDRTTTESSWSSSSSAASSSSSFSSESESEEMEQQTTTSSAKPSIAIPSTTTNHSKEQQQRVSSKVEGASSKKTNHVAVSLASSTRSSSLTEQQQQQSASGRIRASLQYAARDVVPPTPRVSSVAGLGPSTERQSQQSQRQQPRQQQQQQQRQQTQQQHTPLFRHHPSSDSSSASTPVVKRTSSSASSLVWPMQEQQPQQRQQSPRDPEESGLQSLLDDDAFQALFTDDLPATPLSTSVASSTMSWSNVPSGSTKITAVGAYSCVQQLPCSPDHASMNRKRNNNNSDFFEDSSSRSRQKKNQQQKRRRSSKKQNDENDEEDSDSEDQNNGHQTAWRDMMRLVALGLGYSGPSASKKFADQVAMKVSRDFPGQYVLVIDCLAANWKNKILSQNELAVQAFGPMTPEAGGYSLRRVPSEDSGLSMSTMVDSLAFPGKVFHVPKWRLRDADGKYRWAESWLIADKESKLLVERGRFLKQQQQSFKIEECWRDDRDGMDSIDDDDDDNNRAKLDMEEDEEEDGGSLSGILDEDEDLAPSAADSINSDAILDDPDDFVY